MGNIHKILGVYSMAEGEKQGFAAAMAALGVGEAPSAGEQDKLFEAVFKSTVAETSLPHANRGVGCAGGTRVQDVSH